MRRWTEEERRRQSEIARRVKPWLSSTGPRTPAGKASSKLNAVKHGLRCQIVRKLEKTLWKQRRNIDALTNSLSG